MTKTQIKQLKTYGVVFAVSMVAVYVSTTDTVKKLFSKIDSLIK